MFAPDPNDTQYLAVTSTSAKFTTAMEPGFVYRFAANVDCWVKITTTGGAAATNTADNILYLVGSQLWLANPDTDGTTNAFVHVVEDIADGDATLTKYTGY